MSWAYAYQAACEADGVEPRPELLAEEELAQLELHGNCAARFNNRVSDAEVATICKALNSAPGVVEVDLSYNRIGDEGALAIAELLRRNTTIQFISLAHNEIGAEGCRAIADALMLNMTIVGVSLRGNPVGDEGGIALSTMLRGNNTVVSLDVGNCELGTKALLALSLALATHPALCSLKIDKPLVRQPQDLHTIVQHLSNTIGQNRVLAELSMDFFNLGDDHVNLLVPAFVKNESIKVLSLNGNKLSMEGGASVARILSRRPDMVSISLNGNAIDDDGAAAMAIVLRTHPSLEKVALMTNRIGDRGLCALAEGVRVSRSLKQLYLWGNRFEDGAAEAFHKVSKKVATLDYIDFEVYQVDGKFNVCQRND
jgi:Ran GTPase-activating protein (RanGAP) involved in mRNA processing and transport